MILLDDDHVTRLTQRKTQEIIDRGFAVTGFVLSGPDGRKCIVDANAVRWLEGAGFFSLMHPDPESRNRMAEIETALAEVDRQEAEGNALPDR